MSKFFGKQSEYLKFNQKLERDSQLLLFLTLGLGVGFLIRHLWPQFREVVSFGPAVLILVAVLTLPVGTSYWLYLKSKSNEGRFAKGLKSEGKVYFELQKLSDTYSIFQDVKCSAGGNIDFVVVGPERVFAVEVKSLSGQIEVSENEELLVNGTLLDHDPVSQTYSEAKQLEEEGGVSGVIPVLVLTGKVDIHIGLRKVRGVYVVGMEWLNKLLIENQDQTTVTEEQKKHLVHFLRSTV